MGSHVSGEKYRGSYKNGLKEGFGEWTHPDGDNYRGKFKAGIKRGNGVYTFENGEKYKGYFKRDKKHGYWKRYLGRIRQCWPLDFQ